MTDLNSILDTEWNSDNVTKPQIVREEIRTLDTMKRGITVRRIRATEDYMGILDRNKFYTPQTHDAWQVRHVSTTETDCLNIKDEIRRICAEYKGDDPKFITWEVGDFENILNFRWEFSQIVMAEKVGKKIE